MYRVVKTVITPMSVERSSLCTTNNFDTASFWFLNNHAKDTKMYEGRPCFRTKWGYVIRPDKYSTISVEIEQN